MTGFYVISLDRYRVKMNVQNEKERCENLRP